MSILTKPAHVIGALFVGQGVVAENQKIEFKCDGHQNNTIWEGDNANSHGSCTQPFECPNWPCFRYVKNKTLQCGPDKNDPLVEGCETVGFVSGSAPNVHKFGDCKTVAEMTTKGFLRKNDKELEYSCGAVSPKSNGSIYCHDFVNKDALNKVVEERERLERLETHDDLNDDEKTLITWSPIADDNGYYTSANQRKELPQIRAPNDVMFSYRPTNIDDYRYRRFQNPDDLGLRTTAHFSDSTEGEGLYDVTQEYKKGPKIATGCTLLNPEIVTE